MENTYQFSKGLFIFVCQLFVFVLAGCLRSAWELTPFYLLSDAFYSEIITPAEAEEDRACPSMRNFGRTLQWIAVIALYLALPLAYLAWVRLLPFVKQAGEVAWSIIK